MRTNTNSAVCVLAGALLLAYGCQRVSSEKTVSLEPMDIKTPFIVTGPARAQEGRPVSAAAE